MNNVYDGFEIVRNFFSKVFGRNSIDDTGLNLIGSLHYGEDFNNAFWDRQKKQMIFGDGDGILFDYLSDSWMSSPTS